MMTLSDKLQHVLKSVDWNANAAAFAANAEDVATIAAANYRLALWSRQFEEAESGNAALPFIREMQVAGHQVAALIALALYKPAAAAMRTAFETALYFTYFRTHPSELATLVTNPDFFVQKSDLLDYHQMHTSNFAKRQSSLGLVSRINRWYSQISSIVHGQIPGGWTEHRSLSETKHSEKNLPLVINSFAECVNVIDGLFLCTAGCELWESFSADAKRKLTAGLPGPVKLALGLDRA